MDGIFKLFRDENDSEDENDSDDENDYYHEDKKIKIQITKRYNKLLPYTDELEQSRLEWFGNIKKHFFATIYNDNVHHSLVRWVDSFLRYLEIYNFAFTKEDHVFMIKNLYISLKFFQNDLLSSENICLILSRLLRFPKTLSRNDLELDWRVLYTLFKEVHNSSAKKTGLLSTNFQSKSLLKRVVRLSRVYFSKNSTSEMLKEWKPYLYIDHKYFWEYLDYCCLFLPTLMYPEEHEFGYKLWLNDFIQLWSKIHPVDSRSITIKLFARLARDAQGYIDWGPFCFSSLGTIASGKNLTSNQSSVRFSVFAEIIIYAISPNNNNISYFEHFTNMLRKNSISSFSSKIFGKFATLIVRRYRKEKTDCWYNFTAKENVLNEDYLKKLGALLFDSCFEIYFYGKQSASSEQLNALVLLNPELYADRIVEKLNFASEQISEPFRMVKALKIYSSSLFAIITDPNIGPRYRLELIPNLLYLTETFNPYNDDLCFEQILAIHSILWLELPLIDCSSLVHSGLVMDQLEKEICLQSSRVEEFPICFANNCISLIETNNERLFKKLQNYSWLLNDIWISIFSRTSPENSRRVVDKMFAFFKTHTCDGIGIVAIIFIKCCQQFYPGYTLEQNFPYLFDQLRFLIQKNKEKCSDSSKKELLYHIYLLRILLNCDSQQLLPYQDQIHSLFMELNEIDIDSVQDSVQITLQNLFKCFLVQPKLKILQINSESILFKNWPKLIYSHQCKLDWCQPDETIFKMLNRFLQTFYSDSLLRLEEWSESKIELSDDQLLKNLRMIQIDLLYVGSPFLESTSILESKTYLDNCPSLFFKNKLSSFPKRVVITVHKVLEKLKQTKSENTKAYREITWVYDHLFPELFPNMKFHSRHKLLYRKLAPGSSSLFYWHYISTELNHMHVMKKLNEELDSKFTSFHLVMLQDLLSLCVSNNPGTRNSAIKMVQYIVIKFYDSFKLVLDDIINILKNVDDTDSIIGGLKLLHETSQDSLLLSSSWKVLLSLYPVLISLNLADKIEITDLINIHLVRLFRNHFYTIPIEKPHSFDVFISNFQEGLSLGFEMIPTEQLKIIEQKIIETNQSNKTNYFQLIDNILMILNEGNLHWRFHCFGIYLLNHLIRYDVDFPINGIEFYIKNLPNDLLNIRLVCKDGFHRILHKLKPENIPMVVEVDQIPLIDFKNLDCYHDENSYNSQIFLDKTYQGFFKSPFIVKKAGAVQNQIGYQCIANEFFKEDYFDKLFEFNSIEHKKEKNFMFKTENPRLASNAKFWKTFFLIFKLYASDRVFAKIESSLEKRKPSFDRFALKVLSGMIRAANKFNYAEMCQLKAFIQNILEKYYSNFDKESESSWKYLFKAMFFDRDLKRFFWCFEYLFKKIKLGVMTDYYQATCFQHISLAVQNNWKYEHISRDFRSFILNNLDYPIYSVRISYGRAIDSTFFQTYPLNGLELNYKILPVFEEIIKTLATDFEEKLSILFAKQGENDEKMSIIKAKLFDMDTNDGKKLLNSIETVCEWISFALREKEAIEFVRFLPILCVVQINEKNLSLLIQHLIKTLATIRYPSECIDEILASVRMISGNWNWHSRKTVLGFLARFVATTCFILTKQQKSLVYIIENVVELLADSMIEVRNSACYTFQALVSCDLIDSQKRKELIQLFKSQANHERIEIKHSGILGLCAFVNSFPVEVPDFLPDILIFLAQHVQSSNIVSASAMAALRRFKKEHADNWIVHKQKFTADQLIELSDILISPSYYA